MKDYSKTYKNKRNKKSAVLALMSDPMFRSRVEEKRKGKGSYKREKINLKNMEKFIDE